MGSFDGHGVGVFTEWKRRREVTRATFGPFTPWKTGAGIRPCRSVAARKRGVSRSGIRLWRGACGAGGSRGRPLISRAQSGCGWECIRPLGPWQRGRPLRQQARTRAIVGAWRRYRRRATTVALRLYKECDLVVVAGDINRPGGFDFVEGWTRVMPPRDLNTSPTGAETGGQGESGAAHFAACPLVLTTRPSRSGWRLR